MTSERPHSVQHINASNITARHLTVIWKKPFDGYNTITLYFIYLHKQENETCNITDEVDKTKNVSKPHPTTFRDLQPFTSYCIGVQAFNVLGRSNRTLPVTFTTKAAGLFTVVWFSCYYLLLPLCKAPGLVRNISFDAVSSTTIYLTWIEPNEPNGNIFQYLINYVEDARDKARTRRDEENENVVEVAGNTTETIIEGLGIFTSYSITVTAVNKEDGKKLIGNSSKPVVVRTLEDGMSLSNNLCINVRNYSLLNRIVCSCSCICWTCPRQT